MHRVSSGFASQKRVAHACIGPHMACPYAGDLLARLASKGAPTGQSRAGALGFTLCWTSRFRRMQDCDAGDVGLVGGEAEGIACCIKRNA
jgi:hypothetical protein